MASRSRCVGRNSGVVHHELVRLNGKKVNGGSSSSWWPHSLLRERFHATASLFASSDLRCVDLFSYKQAEQVFFGVFFKKILNCLKNFLGARYQVLRMCAIRMLPSVKRYIIKKNFARYRVVTGSA